MNPNTMNPNTVNTVMRCALHICSTAVPADGKLDDFTLQYLNAHGFRIPFQQINEFTNRYNKGAKLYGTYRDSLECVQKPALIREVYRTLWLYRTVVNAYETLTPAALLSMTNAKYEEEKRRPEPLERNQYSCFKIIDKEFSSIEAMKTNGKLLSPMRKDLSLAMNRMEASFASLEALAYLPEIYRAELTPAKTTETKISDGAVKREASAQTTLPEAPAQEKASEAAETADPRAKGASLSSELELQLRDEIRMLQKDKHELEVRLSYAKKDAVREFITTLTDYGWNCPLSELYRLLKDKETPETVRGIINNLFMALGTENIKVTRGKIGERIVLTEENQKSYDPYKNEELFLGDCAEIYYPGYRYDHETMVRPIVRKVRDEEK
ncbi:MAG: hypothetical protein IJD59_05665 [Clostridia bacterium]|nr:hypothetical protein [Clostridia bacterium]